MIPLLKRHEIQVLLAAGSRRVTSPRAAPHRWTPAQLLATVLYARSFGVTAKLVLGADQARQVYTATDMITGFETHAGRVCVLAADGRMTVLGGSSWQSRIDHGSALS